MTHYSPIGGTADARENWRAPTHRSAMLFRAKALLHQARRGMRDLHGGPRRLTVEETGDFSVVLGGSRTPLWPESDPRERHLEQGKVHNLRRAVGSIDRIVVPAGGVFSFWRQVGRARRGRGFVAGRMLQEGCIVPAVGGGLCQLSNALCDVALQAGCEIVERHTHSRVVPGSAAAAERDATIAWNYVDFRFRAPRTMQIEARMSRDELVVRLRGRAGEGPQQTASKTIEDTPPDLGDIARSCVTCGETGCFRHEHREATDTEGVTAYLVDENWPEFQDYIARCRRPQDVLGMPLDGARWRLARYRWRTQGFAQVATATYAAMARAIAVRRLPSQGAARRSAELAAAERIAGRLARLLTADVTRVCVAQSLLPFLWRDGHLGGREVEVLMTRLPIVELQARLDDAWRRHPERATLADFRAPAWLAAAEMAALDFAARIVTPHGEVARLYGAKALKLDWRLPPAAPDDHAARPSGRIAFPGPVVARKGAYEVRAAAQALDVEVVVCGSELEGADFWADVRTLRPEAGRDGAAWLAGVNAVVQPAIVEDRPRHLLAALAARVPVIATVACGLPPHDLLTTIPENDAQALIAALRRLQA